VRAGALLLIGLTSGCDTALNSARLTAVPVPKLGADCTVEKPDHYADELSPRAAVNARVISWYRGAWGAEDASWVIERGGQGCYIENPKPLPADNLTPVTYRFQVSADAFDEIARTLDYDRFKSQLVNCVEDISDAPSGAITWYGEHAPSVVYYNTGAKCTGSEAFYPIMDRVTEQVKAKALGSR
jgi:hypothetical protein